MTRTYVISTEEGPNDDTANESEEEDQSYLTEDDASVDKNFEQMIKNIHELSFKFIF
jgi:hypothetical protein